MTDRKRQVSNHLHLPARGSDLAPHERPGMPMERASRPLVAKAVKIAALIPAGFAIVLLASRALKRA